MRALLLASLILPCSLTAQNKTLENAQTLIIGDQYVADERTVTFGVKPVVSIGHLDPGCTLRFNKDTGLQEVLVVSFADDDKVFMTHEEPGGIKADRTLMSAAVPVVFWIGIKNVYCKCLPGNFASLLEQRRVER